MAAPAPATQQKTRAREVFAQVVRKLGEARDGGCSGPGGGLMLADFATVVGRLEAASSDDGPKGYLRDFFSALLVTGTRG